MTDLADSGLGTAAALALWVAVIVAYVRRITGLPGLYGPVLAAIVGVGVALARWALLDPRGDVRDALVLGFHAAIIAMGGYSGLRKLTESDQPANAVERGQTDDTGPTRAARVRRDQGRPRRP